MAALRWSIISWWVHWDGADVQAERLEEVKLKARRAMFVSCEWGCPADSCVLGPNLELLYPSAKPDCYTTIFLPVEVYQQYQYDPGCVKECENDIAIPVIETGMSV
ncbi:hypothetical protein EV359DRAFT_60842 [Lentinula novae-zelandiae]|nr:hypothetical protein EV359DRAFT_60842 [Lentinula novae-zelandiae]